MIRYDCGLCDDSQGYESDRRTSSAIMVIVNPREESDNKRDDVSVDLCLSS